jgi:hypothetical protein
MKVKLFKILSSKAYDNYIDDYDEITRYTIENFSDWEEVDNNDLYTLEKWVREKNIYNKKEFWLLAQPEDKITCKMAIAEQVEREKERSKKLIESEKKRKQDAIKNKKERELKRVTKLKKELAALEGKSKDA